MKTFLSIAVAAALLISLSACGKTANVIVDSSNKSYFVDFYTEDESVYIECVLNIYNSSDNDIEIQIKAIDNEDVKTGLIKTPELIGKDKSGNDRFKLSSGENEITVYFVGEYAGMYNIASRCIPRFIYTEIL